MKYAGLISLLSVPAAVVLALVSLSGKDTSGLAGIAVGATIFVAAFIAAIIGIIAGAIALKSGTSTIPGTIGMIIGLIIVGMTVWWFLSDAMDERAENKKVALKKKAEKTAYDASPDINSNSITNLLESPHLQVTIKDIAELPNRKFLVFASIEGGRSGPKLEVYSSIGQLDSDFISQPASSEYSRDIIIKAPNGDFSIIDEMRDYPDYKNPWNANEPGLLRNKHGKIIATINAEFSYVNFAQDGKLYGLEWNDDSDSYVNLVELPIAGKEIRRSVSIARSVLSQMHLNDFIGSLNFKDLFFWPSGDIGIITSGGHVFRIDPTGKRILSSIKTSSEQDRGLSRCLGFLSDGSLILTDKHNRNRIVQYRNGKIVVTFTKAVQKICESIDIHTAGVTGNGEVIIAGNPHDKKNAIQFVFIDTAGKVRNGFLLGKDN